MAIQITDEARRTVHMVIRIDQGDFLQERGGFDWGRAESHDRATVYSSIDEAIEAIRRLGIESIARAIEPWDDDFLDDDDF